MRLISSTRTSCYVEMIAIITLSLSNLHCYVGLRKFDFVQLTKGDCVIRCYHSPIDDLVSSVRSSYSHSDLLLTHQQQHPTFSDHTGPQHWTFTF